MTTMTHQYFATWFYDDDVINYVLSKNKVIETSSPSNPDLVDTTLAQKEEIIERYKKTSSTLNQLNKKIFESTNYLKPTNKDISDALGLCERQVNYYVKAIKRLTDDSSNNHEE